MFSVETALKEPFCGPTFGADSAEHTSASKILGNAVDCHDELTAVGAEGVNNSSISTTCHPESDSQMPSDFIEAETSMGVSETQAGKYQFLACGA